MCIVPPFWPRIEYPDLFNSSSENTKTKLMFDHWHTSCISCNSPNSQIPQMHMPEILGCPKLLTSASLILMNLAFLLCGYSTVNLFFKPCSLNLTVKILMKMLIWVEEWSVHTVSCVYNGFLWFLCDILWEVILRTHARTDHTAARRPRTQTSGRDERRRTNRTSYEGRWCRSIWRQSWCSITETNNTID